jgi:hypothetical protein
LSLELGIFIAAVRDPICDSIFAQWGQLSDEEREKVSQVLTSYLELYPSVVHADRDIRFNKLFYAHTERGDAKMRSSLKLSDLRHPLGWG